MVVDLTPGGQRPAFEMREAQNRRLTSTANFYDDQRGRRRDAESFYVPSGSGLCEGGAAVAFEKADDQYRVVICRRNSLQANIRLESGSILHEHLRVLTRIRRMKPAEATQVRRDVMKKKS